MNISHSTQKDDAGKVTHYDITADGVLVGKATKGEKGKFNLEPVKGSGLKAVSDLKTMRDLKLEVEKSVSADFVAKNEPMKKTSKPKEDKVVAADDVVDAELNRPEDQAIVEGGEVEPDLLVDADEVADSEDIELE